MTVHALVADPPRPGLALPGLVSTGKLGSEAAASLAGAMLQDVAIGAANSGGELLVNHPMDEQLSPKYRRDMAPVDELRELIAGVLADPEAVRFEPQVGESRAARIENTVGHLLEEEGATSVAVLDGRAPTLDRTALDSAAMKLRRSEVVVAPAPGNRVAYLGLTEPLELADLAVPFELTAIADRAVEVGYEVDYLPMHPRVDDEAGLQTLTDLVAARRVARRRVPERTATVLETLDG